MIFNELWLLSLIFSLWLLSSILFSVELVVFLYCSAFLFLKSIDKNMSFSASISSTNPIEELSFFCIEKYKSSVSALMPPALKGILLSISSNSSVSKK